MAVVRVKQGDVLSLPTGDGRMVLGQVAEKPYLGTFFMAIFETVLPEDTEQIPFAEIVANDEIRLLSHTSDLFVELGKWAVVGNAPVRTDIPMPAYKVSIDQPGNYFVEDWTGKHRRPARPEEVARLPYRGSFSPAAVAGAVRASLGLEPWLEGFGKMLPGGVTTAEAFGDD